jgi:carbon starvation protein
MNGAILLLIAAACFLGGYFLYARKLERLLGIDPKRPTPAHTKGDGVDYVPAHPAVLFGHHFATIAGAGPIVGPVLAAEFGWASVAIWVVLGCIFIGAAHDMITMFLSVRHDGESIGSVIGTFLGSPGKLMFLLVSWSGLVLLVAEFTRQIVGTFVADPAVATASLLFIAEAVAFGVCVYRFRISVLAASLVFVPLMFAFVWIGNAYPLDLVKLFGLSPDAARTVWTVVLIAYCFLASTCPVQFLLQPRDYLNSYLLYAMMLMGFLGVFVAHPVLHIDAFAGFSVVGRSGMTDLLFPFLFVTVACGACSGFHALVASGTSSKQIANERSIRPVAYGGMLLEGVLAIIAVIGVAGTYMSQKEYVSAIQSMEPVQMFAATIAGFCCKVGIPQRAAEGFMLLSVAAFLMTSVDSSTRLARFTWQELMPSKDGFFHNLYVGTAAVCAVVVALLLGSPDTARQLWTLFASTNQMLASLTLLTATLWFYRNKKPCWMTAVPMTLMFVVSSWALASILVASASAGQWVRLFASAFLLTLAVAIIVVTVGKKCKM